MPRPTPARVDVSSVTPRRLPRAFGWRRSPGPPLDLQFDEVTVEPEGLALLSELVTLSRVSPGPIVEIGTMFGQSAVHLALSKAPSQKVVTVDDYTWNPCGLSPESHFALTSMVLGYLVQTGHVELLRMNKNDFYAAYEGPAPALVFLDAVHTYEETAKDIRWARSVGAALVAGHDYTDRWPGVKRAVHEFGGPRKLSGSVFLL